MLDPALIDAINEVVEGEGQPKSVASRLIAWLTQMSDGDPGRDENTHFLTNVRDALVLGGGDED